MAENYYDRLEVAPQASGEEIKKAYRILALRFHPDRNPRNRHFFEERFRLINEAYEILKTKEKRIIYDRTLQAGNDNQIRSSWFSLVAELFRPVKNASQSKA